MHETPPTILAWVRSAEDRIQAGTGSKAEMLALLEELKDLPAAAAPALPADLTFGAEESAALSIKMHLLRARLEMSHEQAEEPVSLVRLLGLLTELSGQLADLESFLKPVWAVWRQYARSKAVPEPAGASLSLREAMRSLLLDEGPGPLRSALSSQRQAAQFCLVFQSALKKAGSEFAREISAEFDPAAIASAARSQNPQARGEEFWGYYTEQADRLTPSEVERRLTRLLVAAIEELFHQIQPADS